MKKNWLYWTPRILSILFVLFVSLFAFDVFDNGGGFFQIVIALFIHLIPSFILLIVLIISWKYELVGGIAFILAGIIYILLLFTRPEFEIYMIFWSLIIAGPAFFIGILWLLNWKNKKKRKRRK